MKLGNKTRIAAWLFAAAVLAADISGNSVPVYAASVLTGDQEESSITKEKDEKLETEETEDSKDRNPVQEDHLPEENFSEDTNAEERDLQREETVQEGQAPSKEESQQDKEPKQGRNLEEETMQEEEHKTQEDNYERLQEQAFGEMLREYDMYGVLTNAAQISIFQDPSQDAPVTHTLPSGSQVRFLGVTFQEGEVWFQVAYGVKDVEYTGFIPSDSVVTGDPRLAQWKEECQKAEKDRTAGLNSVNPKGSTDLSAFPASYRTFIEKLIQIHPNWTFVPMNTGLSWAEVVKNEMVNSRNLVDINHPVTWKSTAPEDYNMATGEWIIKNGTTWVQASESIVKYYLDPRNFINENSVFQFEQLTYNSACHTESGVEKILSGTFMANKKLEDGSGGGITYAKAFMKIGKDLKVSPYFLASRVRQEQGVNGTSKLISGTYPGFEGYYNYFNISATGIGEQVIISGLTEAKNAGWTTRYAALYGGAKKTAENYISKGQDTFYLQKFDVDDSYHGLYWHQYMQNLLAADNESKNIRNSYTSMGALDNSFVFKVPVYNDMPSSLCPLPGDTLSKPTLKATKKETHYTKLSWGEVGGAQGYQVYRKEGSNGKYEKIKTLRSLTDTSYKDKKITPGKTYTYKVRAFLKLNAGNFYSKCSSEKTVDYQISPVSWQKFSLKNYTTITLGWTKADVDGYLIYRKTDSGKYTKIQSIRNIDTLSYQDKTVIPGHTYSYRIRSFKKVDGKNYYSSYTSVKKKEIKMQAPELSSITVSGTTKAKLTWKKDSKATGYYVYRSNTITGGYKKVKTIKSNSTLNWTDSGIASGQTYYYKIRSYVETSEGKKNSGYSKAMMVETKIDKPTITNVTASYSGVKLTWKKSADASGYQVYRSDSYNGNYKSVKKVTENSTVAFMDKNVTLGKTYYYKVRAYKTVGKNTKYSSWSAVTSAQPELTGTKFTKISRSNAGQASLKWNKVSDAQGYKVYRKTGKNGKYQMISNLSGAGTVSYTDKGLVKGNVYYYKIRTWRKINGKVCYSAYSDAWCVEAQ